MQLIIKTFQIKKIGKIKVVYKLNALNVSMTLSL